MVGARDQAVLVPTLLQKELDSGDIYYLLFYSQYLFIRL
jgi:hypothetical protein